MARGYSGFGGTVKFAEGSGTPANLSCTLVRDFTVTQDRESAEVTPIASTTGMCYVPSPVIATRVSVNGFFRPTALLRAYTAQGCALTLDSFTDTFAMVTDFTMTMTRTAVDVTAISETSAAKFVPSSVINTRLSAGIIWDPNASENPPVSGATYGEATLTFTDAGPCVATLSADADTNKGVYVESFEVQAENDGTHVGTIELACSGALFGFSPSFTLPITETYGKLELTYSDGAVYSAPATVASATNVGAFCESWTITGTRGGAIESNLVYVLSGERFP